MIIVGTTVVVDQPPIVDAGPAVYPLSWSWEAPWLAQAWTLTDLASPVLKLRGATGTGQGEPEHWWADVPTLDGSQWGGVRIARGELFVPLMVRGTDTADFLVNHSQFRQALDPRQESLVTVSRPDGDTRTASCRYVSGGDLPIELDPVAQCMARYGITWALADPFWSGPTVTTTFANDPGSPFFPGPPFVIGRGLTLNNATITNPGDVDAYATWRVSGPFTSFGVGIGDSLVQIETTKSAGQWVEIDMNPRRLTILDNAGSDLWPLASSVDFVGIPPGADVPLSLNVLGAGVSTQVDLSFTPRYWAAW